MLSACSSGNVTSEQRRNDREVLGDVVRDRERRQRAARHQELLADLDDLDQLRRVRVEIDHVAGFLRRLRAGVHRHADVGLRQRRRVVGAVAGHRHEVALRLLLADQRELVLGRGLGEEVVDAGFACDGRGGQRVVAGDHDGADAHHAQTVEALLHPALDDVLQIDRAEDLLSSATTSGVPPSPAIARHVLLHLLGERPADRADVLGDGIGGAFANGAAAVEIDSGHARLRGERNDRMRAERLQLTAAQPELLLRQDDDRASLGRLVGKRGELRDLGERRALRRRARR